MAGDAARRAAWTAAAMAPFLLVGWLWLFVEGTVLVSDGSGAVVRAEQVTGVGIRPLHALPGGRFFAIPSNDGTVRLRCRDGTAKEIGYVTGGSHTRVRLDPGDSCADAREL